MALPATLYLPDQSDSRAAERIPVGRTATVRVDSKAIDAVVHDFSTSGCRVEAVVDLPVGSAISLGVSGAGRITAQVVWREGHRYGCSFDRPIPQESVLAATSADTVIPFSHQPESIFDEPDAERWPRPVRLAVIVISAGLCWAALLALI